MEGWKRWEGKKVFLVLKNNRKYQGVVEEVHDSGDGLIFLSITDKFGKWVTFTISEIDVIQEEGR